MVSLLCYLARYGSITTLMVATTIKPRWRGTTGPKVTSPGHQLPKGSSLSLAIVFDCFPIRVATPKLRQLDTRVYIDQQ